MPQLEQDSLSQPVCNFLYLSGDAGLGHIPYRNSALTRLLKDSLGGSARTSLIICASPNPADYSETTSTLLFGQRASKVENTIRQREEVDYQKLCSLQEAKIAALSVGVENIEYQLTSARKTIEILKKDLQS